MRLPPATCLPMLQRCSSSPRRPAIRAVYQQRGEFSAAVELRRRFPGITDNAQARECARTIAGWKPLAAALPLRRVRLPPRKSG